MKKIAAFISLVAGSMLSLAACGAPEPGDMLELESAEGVQEEDIDTAEQALGAANWSACSSDSACASNWCGCNGGTTRVCLPNTSYPKYCGNWTACWSDAQCASNWCGCNGGNVSVCLPNSGYSKGCSL